MPRARRRLQWSCIAFAALAMFATAMGNAKDSSTENSGQYLPKGNPKAAEIELRNAVREAPQDPALRARLAQVYLELGDLVAAEREARAARDRNGDEADYLPVFADALLRQNKFAEVQALIEPGDRNPALESKVRLALGIAAAALSDQDKAETMLRWAIRLDRGAVKPKLQLALFLAPTSPEEADKLADEAVAADPNSPEALQLKGEMLRVRGDPDGAMRLFEKVLEIDPGNALGHLSRADLNIVQDKFSAADADLDPILRASPNHFLANFLRAFELAKQQQYGRADQILDRISPAFTTFWAGYYLQAATKLSLGQYARGEYILSTYLGHVPNDQRAVRLIATAALRQGAAPRAIEYLKSAVDRLPADAATMSLLGDAYLADGKLETALRQYEKAASVDPENPAIKTRVAISEIDTGQGQKGLADLEQVFATEAGATVAGPTLVLSELHARRVDKAAQAAASLAEHDADNPLYQTLLGEARDAQRDYPAAENAFRAALARNPEFAPAARDLAQRYWASGRPDDAKKVYNELLARKAGDVTALLGLADIAVAQQKWAEAVDFINRARTAARNDPAPGLKLAALYESQKDWADAKTVAGELAAQFPRDADVLDALGRAQFAGGDVDGAIATYQRAYQLAPDSTRIRTRYLALLKQARDFREAWNVLVKAVEKDPRNAGLKADLIRAEAEVFGLDAGFSKARQFAKDDPENSIYDLASAELYQAAGRSGEALVLLEKAVAARPTADDLTVALARLYTRSGDFAQAEAVLTRRLKTDPKNLAAASVLAPLYVTIWRPSEAEKLYDGILSQRPNDVAALLGLADIAVTEKRWTEAGDAIDRARVAALNDPAPGFALVYLYGLRQDWKNAAAAAAELAEKFPDNPDVFDTRARVQISAGDTEAALASYKRAYELASGSPQMLAHYVAVLRAANRFSEARSVLQTALDRDPRSASLKGDLIRVEADIGGLDAGLEAARLFAKGDPQNSTYDLVRAEIYEKAGQSDAAITLLETSSAEHPSDDNVTIALCRLYMRASGAAKAEAILKARLKAEPKDFAIRSALASFYAEQEKFDAAIAELTGLIAERPADAEALNDLAWLYQQQGNLTRARAVAEHSFTLAPRAAHIIDTLGWVLLAQGEVDRGLIFLSSAGLSDPRNPDIRYHLAVALQRADRPADARAVLERLLGSGISFADRGEAEKLLQDLKSG